jgi:hypothetical protein
MMVVVSNSSVECINGFPAANVIFRKSHTETHFEAKFRYNKTQRHHQRWIHKMVTCFACSDLKIVWCPLCNGTRTISSTCTVCQFSSRPGYLRTNLLTSSASDLPSKTTRRSQWTRCTESCNHGVITSQCTNCSPAGAVPCSFCS